MRVYDLCSSLTQAERDAACDLMEAAQLDDGTTLFRVANLPPGVVGFADGDRAVHASFETADALRRGVVAS